MLRTKLFALTLFWVGLTANCSIALAENEGLEELDKATQLKVTAEDLDDLNEVVDLLETSLEKGLDEENTKFAEQLLVASLMQRATLFSTAAVNLPAQDQQQRLRSMQFRQFALTDLQRAVQVDEKLWDAYLMLGKLQSLPLGDATAARRAFTKVINAEESTAEQKAEALVLRSAVAREPENQAEDLDRAVELQPEKPEYLRLRAQYRYNNEKFDDALADIDRALALDTEHAATHELRGMILLGLERYDEALAAFDRASELVPQAALPYQHRGQLYLKKGNPEKAVEQLTKALELAPESVATLLVRAGIYYEQEKTDLALKDIEEAIRIQPQLVHPHLMRAEIYAATDRLDEAIDQLEQLLEMAPGQVQVLSSLGGFYMIDGKPRKAIDAFTKVLENEAVSENDSDTARNLRYRALRYRADAYLNIGEHHESIADFEKVLDLNDDPDEGVLNNFAWVLATSPEDQLRDGKRAIELATKAAEMTNHQTPHVLSTLAAAYAETGDFETAQKWSTKAIELAQKALEAAESDEERTRLKTEHEQLQKELASFKEGKPVRERQSVDEEEEGDQPSKDRAV